MKQETTRNPIFKAAITAFVASASFAGIVGHASTSEAFWTRQDASYCMPSLGDPAFNSNGCNTTTTGAIVVSCPVQDSSTHPKTSIVNFNLHVDDKSPSFLIAHRCVNFFAAVGASCGATDTSVNGLDTLFPATFAGWNATDFGFISVTIPSRSGGNNSCIKGYYTDG